MIQLFGTPNGLCSSITESKHIKAVKEPWHCSNRYEALGQMLLSNQHADKLDAIQAHFTAHNMVDRPHHTVNRQPSLALPPTALVLNAMLADDDRAHDSPQVIAEVVLAASPGACNC